MNRIALSGTITSDLEYSHEVVGEKFFKFYLQSCRNRGICDRILCIASELFTERIAKEKEIFVDGEVRTRNCNNHLIIFVFVFGIYPVNGTDKNEVALQGFICKQPIYRKTPKGCEIADFFVASNRAYKKSDYIPCITWGGNARFASELEVGAQIRIEGRFQSREYLKKISDEEYEIRTAYEVSANTIEVIEETEDINENSN